MEPSQVVFYAKDLNKISKLLFWVFRSFGLVKVTEKLVDEHDKENICYESSNFTLINFYLTKMGPTGEGKLTFNLLIVQVFKFLFFFYKFLLKLFFFNLQRQSAVQLRFSLDIKFQNCFTN